MAALGRKKPAGPFFCTLDVTRVPSGGGGFVEAEGFVESGVPSSRVDVQPRREAPEVEGVACALRQHKRCAVPTVRVVTFGGPEDQVGVVHGISKWYGL